MKTKTTTVLLPCNLISVFFCFILSPSLCSSLNSDGLSLLALKSAITSDPTRFLSTWSDSDITPCNWVGVRCTFNRVTDLVLPNKRLTGYIPSELGAIVSLRRLSLTGNNFSKPIPLNLFNATGLVSLELSHNSFTGPIPPQIKNLKNLSFLDLSSNLLNGTLPVELVQLTQLTGTLNLSYNEFSGMVPVEYGNFPVMISLDLRHNNLTGKIPQVGSLLNQGPTAFAGNPSLCGFPLSTQCPEAQNPNIPSSPGNDAGGTGSSNGDPTLPGSGDVSGTRSGRNGPVSVTLVSGVVVIVAAAGLVSFVWVIRKRRGRGRSDGDRMGEKEKAWAKGEEAEAESVDGGGQKGQFVVLDDEGFGLELEDLLRASAYVVGKSRSGIVYRVVVMVGGGKGSGVAVGGGTVVAVRRLSEADDAAWRFKEFESEVEAIGRVQHQNIVRLRAYYYAKDEKLLISDFIRNGSLYTALHGGHSNNVAPLSWAQRIKIAQGAARGLLHIHECSARKYVHGNIKTSKILLDEEFESYISGFGLTSLVSGSSKSNTLLTKRHGSTNSYIISPKILGPSSNAYVAPEARAGNKFTQKCDVYSFGIVLMELLTGQLPDAGPENDGKGLEGNVRKIFREEKPLSEIIDPALLHEVYAKKQVLATFHVALSCTELDPELRPRMRAVYESLDRVDCH